MITIAYFGLLISFALFSIRLTALAAIISSQNKPNFSSWIPDIAFGASVALAIWSLKTIFA